jgi:hypothetical protein
MTKKNLVNSNNSIIIHELLKWQVSSPEVTIDYISVWDGLCGKIHNCNSACSTPQSSKHLAGVVVVQKLKFTSFISAGVFWFVVNLENCSAHVMYAKYFHCLL